MHFTNPPTLVFLRVLLPAACLLPIYGACSPIDSTVAIPSPGAGGTTGSNGGSGGGGASAGTQSTTGGVMSTAGSASMPRDPMCPPELLALGVASGQLGPLPPKRSRYVSATSDSTTNPDAGSSPDAGSFAPDLSSADAGTQNASDADAGGHWGDEITDLFGWAERPGIGVNSTTGGAGAPVVTATSARSLAAFAQREEALYIQVCGFFEADSIRVASNKTIVGLGADSGIVGGFDLQDPDGRYVSNVVLRNLRIDASSSLAGGDGIRIHRAHHVWIDHCDVYNSPDVLVSVESGSDYLTLSWNRFFFNANAPDPERRLGILIGDSNDPEVGALDEAHLNVTLHHNWFAELVRQRTPRVRFGDVHVLNNYYTVVGEWAIWSGTGARVFVEGNYFDGTQHPHQQSERQFDPDPPYGEITAADNIYDDTTGDQLVVGAGFTPPYEYPVSNASELPNLVMRNTGPQ